MKSDAGNLDPRVKKLIWIVSIFAFLAVSVIAIAAQQAGKVYQSSWKTRAVARQMLEVGFAGYDPEKEEKLLAGQTKLMEAQMLALRKKYAEAHNAYEEATHSLSSALTPTSPFLSEVYRHQGDFECCFEKWDQAEGAYRRALGALRTDGSDEEQALSIEDNRVYVLRRGGKYQQAVELARANLNRAEKAHLDLGPPLMQLAKSEISLNKLSEAEQHSTRAIALHPDKSDYYCHRADLYSWQGLDEKALADHLKALSIDPKNAERHLSCADDYKALGRLRDAVEQYTLSIALDPKSRCAYDGRASAHHELGQYEDELQDLNQILKLDSKDASDYALRGDCYEKLGQHNLALKDYNAAISLAEEKDRIFYRADGSRCDKWLKVYAYEKRAKVFDALGRPDQSAADIKIARRIESFHPTISAK